MAKVPVMRLWRQFKERRQILKTRRPNSRFVGPWRFVKPLSGDVRGMWVRPADYGLVLGPIIDWELSAMATDERDHNCNLIGCPICDRRR